MVFGSGAAGGDDGYADGIGDRAGEFEVVAVLATVTIHAGEQDFARAARYALFGPFNRVEFGRVASAVRVDFPTLGRIIGIVAPRVDGEDGALATKLLGAFVEDVGVGDGGGVEGNLIGPGVEHLAHIGGRADAAADGQRHKYLFGDATDNVDHRVAFVARRGDIKKDEFVGALRLVGLGTLDGIARIDQVDELYTFDHAATGDVETGNNSFCQHRKSFTN